MRKKTAKWKGIFFLLPSFFWSVPILARSLYRCNPAFFFWSGERRVYRIFQLCDHISKFGISACCKKHPSFFCSMYSTTCVFISGSGCFYIWAETLSSDDKKFLFAAYGNPGCFCCSFVEAYVSRPGNFKPFSFLFLHRWTGLHEYQKFFLCTGI